MTPQEKRKQTIIRKYGSFKAMLAGRDVRDLILGGINGGRVKNDNKGFGSWDEREIKRYARKRNRDTRGRFAEELPEVEVRFTNPQD